MFRHFTMTDGNSIKDHRFWKLCMQYHLGATFSKCISGSMCTVLLIKDSMAHVTSKAELKEMYSVVIYLPFCYFSAVSGQVMRFHKKSCLGVCHEHSSLNIKSSNNGLVTSQLQSFTNCIKSHSSFSASK